MQTRAKLHPSTCFPPSPGGRTTRNRLFIRKASNQPLHHHPCLTFIGFDASAYSAIAALLVRRPSTSIERIQLFDPSQKPDACVTLHDLQVLATLNGGNTSLQWVQSYWQTRSSSILIINVQHHQLAHESAWAWVQANATLVESVVSQACRYSPHATLIICTQPNELMTYVAFRASKFPSERVLGLGASVGTARVHQAVLERLSGVRGRVNGFFILGSGLEAEACATTLSDHLTIDGISCSEVFSETTANRTQNISTLHPLGSASRQTQEWDLIHRLTSRQMLFSDIQRHLPLSTNLPTRQKTVAKHLRAIADDTPNRFELSPPPTTPAGTQSLSSRTLAMIVTRLTRALIHGDEFQSNLVVNIGPVHQSRNVFINYPTIVGSSPQSIAYMLPIPRAQNILNQRTFLIPFEKLQNKLGLSRSKD